MKSGFLLDSLALASYNWYSKYQFRVWDNEISNLCTEPLLKKKEDSAGKKAMQTLRRTILVVVTAVGLTSGIRAANSDKSLFERLGGKSSIQAVVNDFVDRILADERVNKWFAHASSSPENANAYKAKLADFLCQQTGGPCQYTGRDMIAAHKGRGVTSDAFGAVVQDLVATLEKFKVPEREKRDLLELLGPMKPAIVQK